MKTILKWKLFEKHIFFLLIFQFEKKKLFESIFKVYVRIYSIYRRF
jgi:hypothetical protein